MNANELVAEVHDRMPVILDPTEYAAWLDPVNEDRDKLQSMLDQFPADQMTARPVSTYLSNARHEGVECLNPPD
jgi:putative SOS response-associated peptidase YedK